MSFFIERINMCKFCNQIYLNEEVMEAANDVDGYIKVMNFITKDENDIYYIYNVWHSLIYVSQPVMKINYCPECGRKL